MTSNETPKPKDPMKGFRGVMSGTLIMEAITVALALPVVNKLGGGISTGTGWTVIAVAAVLIVTCGFVKRPWAVPLILGLQVVLIALVFWLPAIAVLGVLFLAVWLWLLWLRKDVARRMAAGTLASQQPGAGQPR
ncbi:DUF4233 domain-containing protein [Amycolatopsis sp. OK19-0408]|uniref:DUF4233 domain-containing protein n=2 Tax=Amycolatopsis iheyensis TaxID=2945988 RepID=A0A9X2SKG6_9PSEU|nr:DUF4233 domain-containing protein [Amycolatopsis iheyensis]MCR6483355.1 DUF4233 domain-containing protein [Amycolatopsis iheyensis]